MAGNKIGAAKAAATNKARHGADFYKRIGARGGNSGTTCDIIAVGGKTMYIKDCKPYQILSSGIVIGVNGLPKKPQIDKKGYMRVQVHNESGKVETRKVHRLVAQHFIKNPDNLPQVDHIDCDKTNNDVSNLCWVSNEENQRRAVANGAYYNRKPKSIINHGGKALKAILDGYYASDVLPSFGIERKTFWKYVNDGDINPDDYVINKNWKKTKYYYYDKTRGKWRVERSDYIKIGKQFDTENEAKEYASNSIGGGFAHDKSIAISAGKKGGSNSKRGYRYLGRHKIDDAIRLYEKKSDASVWACDENNKMELV